MTETAPEGFPSRWRASAAYGLLGATLVFTVVLPIVGARYGDTIRPETIDTSGLFLGQIVLAVFLGGWYALARPRDWRAYLSLPRGNWGARILTGARIGLLGWLLTLATMAILGGIGYTAGAATPREGFVDLMLWLARLPIAIRLALITSAMILEEAFFRAFLQPRIGAIAATVCFTLAHANYGSPLMGVGIVVIGCVLARAFQKHHDVAVCAVAHGVFDGIQLLVVLPLVASRL